MKKIKVLAVKKVTRAEAIKMVTKITVLNMKEFIRARSNSQLEDMYRNLLSEDLLIVN